MKRLTFLASAVALAAAPAHADPGHGHGGGGGNAHGPGHAGPGNARGGGNGPGSMGHGGGMSPGAMGHGGGNGPGSMGHGRDKGPAKVSHGRPDKGPPQKVREQRAQNNRGQNDRGPPAGHGAGRPSKPEFAGRQGPVGRSGAPRHFDASRRVARFEGDHVPGSGWGVVKGCPPGLAKKHDGCMPPGLARPNWWQRASWFGFNYPDRYRFANGYMLRLGDSGAVLGYVPLLGGALRVGSVWPIEGTSTLRPYYTDYYGLPAGGYRTYGDVIYRVDPKTAAITSVAALLTGNDIAVGQPMPLGYEVYNVPLAYRSRYVDGPTAIYRYSDGYVYRLDPETRLVEAALELAL